MTLFSAIYQELRAIFTNPAIVLTVFGGVLFYSFLYPLPYSQQVPREQKVAVVNLDGSQLSRQLERMVNATPQVQLVARAASLEEARVMLAAGEISGVLVIPEFFYRDLLLGNRPTLSFAGDASYFLVYGTVLEGMAAAGGTLAGQVKFTRLVAEGQPTSQAMEQLSPLRLSLLPAFNTTMGYVNYVIPAVFILILHQTLVMGAGLLAAGQYEDRKRVQPELPASEQVSPGLQVLVRAAVFTALYWLLCYYYFGFCFSFYEIPRGADLIELQLLMLPFLLAASFFGICLGAMVPRRELVTLLVLLSSMVLIFGAGFIWPVAEISPLVAVPLQLIPVVPAIMAFLGLNQLGAELTDISHYLLQLWLAAGGYGILAWWLTWRRQR